MSPSHFALVLDLRAEWRAVVDDPDAPVLPDPPTYQQWLEDEVCRLREGAVKLVPQPVIGHAFPIAGRKLRPGDVAYCGYVKKLPDPDGPTLPVSATECVVCADVARSRGHYQ